MKRSTALLAVVVLATSATSGCAATPPPTPIIIYVTPAPSPIATPTAAPTPKPTPEPTPAPVSVVCDVFGAARDHFLDAFNADVLGSDPGPDLLNATSDIRAVIERARIASEEKDMSALAEAFGRAAVSGGGWSEADSAYEPFFVKYAAQCGLPIAQ